MKDTVSEEFWSSLQNKVSEIPYGEQVKMAFFLGGNEQAHFDVALEKSAAGIIRGLGRLGRKYLPTFANMDPNRLAFAGVIASAVPSAAITTYERWAKNKADVHSDNPTKAVNDYYKKFPDTDETTWQKNQALLRHRNSWALPETRHHAAVEARNAALYRMRDRYINANKPVPNYLEARYRARHNW